MIDNIMKAAYNGTEIELDKRSDKYLYSAMQALYEDFKQNRIPKASCEALKVQIMKNYEFFADLEKKVGINSEIS